MNTENKKEALAQLRKLGIPEPRIWSEGKTLDAKYMGGYIYWFAQTGLWRVAITNYDTEESYRKEGTLQEVLKGLLAWKEADLEELEDQLEEVKEEIETINRHLKG